MDFQKTLCSLVKPMVNGTFQVLTGGFGPIVAIIAWIQFASIALLAVSHAGTIAGALALAMVMAISLAAGALLAFLIVNGSAYGGKPQGVAQLVMTSVLASGCLVAVLTSAGFAIASLFFGTHSMLALGLATTLITAVNSCGIVLVIFSLTGKK